MSHVIISWLAESVENTVLALFVSKREITKLLSQYPSVIVLVDIKMDYGIESAYLQICSN